MKKEMKIRIRNFIIIAFLILPLISPIVLVSYRVNTHLLISAIRKDDVEGVERILKRGTDPNLPEFPPSKFWSLFEMVPTRPLSVACEIGNYEVVKLLVDYGATADNVEGTDWGPFIKTLFIYNRDDAEIIKLLLENSTGSNYQEGDLKYIVEAANTFPRLPDSEEYDEQAAKDITEIVILFLDRGESINSFNSAGQTLLILAVKRENIPLAEYLISQGCDLDAADVYGKTAADYAVESENQELITLFN